MTTETVYITVISRSPEQIPAYLYAGVEIQASGEIEDSVSTGSWFVLTAPSHYAGEYQAGRLNSGLHASRVHETLVEAADHLLAVFGVTAS